MLPISLPIISRSFTKEVEQISLRLYLRVSSGSLVREHKILEKRQYFTRSTQIFISGTLKCLLAPIVLESWIFYRTCLKVSEKQVFFNHQLLFRCLTKTRKIKSGRLPFLSFPLKEVTPHKYLSNFFLRNSVKESFF